MTIYWPSLVVLAGGILFVGFFLYLNVFKKQKIVGWLAKHVFRNQLMSEKSAENLLMTATSFLLMIGGLWIILALYYLVNG